MRSYSISFTRSARKELSGLDRSVVSRIFPKIESLMQDPHLPGCRKLEGAGELWRIRVGNYRVVYRVLDQELIIEVITVRHRKDAYHF